MSSAQDREDIALTVERATGVETTTYDYWTITDPDAALAADVEAIRSSPLLPSTLEVLGYRYDVETGELRSSG